MRQKLQANGHAWRSFGIAICVGGLIATAYWGTKIALQKSQVCTTTSQTDPTTGEKSQKTNCESFGRK